MTAPVNNEWANATILAGTSGSVTVVTFGADPQPPTYIQDGTGTGPASATPSGALEHTVWYAWTAPAGDVEVDTLPTDASLHWDSYLEVFEMPTGGTTVDDLVYSTDLAGGLARNDDSSGTTLSKVSWTADGGRVYYIRVSDWPDGPGGNDGVTDGVLHYSPVTTTIPPLRQFPRDDGLRRTPGRSAATSRQGSLRRGPRGTYT